MAAVMRYTDSVMTRLFQYIRPLAAVALCLAITCRAGDASAAPLIRDAEIEHTLHQYADPIFIANGLKPSAIKIFIVNDDALNAFVAGGANLFVNSGLIMSSPTPDMLLGVMAHETGHIAGGHLARGTEKLKDATMGTIFSYVLGAAAAAASGRPEAAAAVITGGHTTMARNFLAYTRSHEEAADQSALNALDKMGVSASGLLKVFELLRRHEREKIGSPDPYMISHPLTSLRIEHMRSHVEQSKIPEGQYPRELNLPHQRMIAKLYGFLQTPERTFMKYPQGDKSVPARMARAIAYYKMPDLTRSIAEMDSLIAESPKDPFFHELKGQIYFENNKPKEAMQSYRKAVELLPDAPLILLDMGRVELAQGDPSLLPSATAHLEKSSQLDNSNAMVWRQLAIAYGKANNQPMASLALAEEALLVGDPKRALQNVNQAMSQLREGTPAYRHASDVKLQAIELQKEKDDQKSPF
jgi:predicted Zn-dependent protease